MIQPTVSIVIPTYNRKQSLVRCLQAIFDLDYPVHEVIVVDDGGDMLLDSVACDYPIVFVRQANAGPASARNRGIEIATGDYVAFVDDDTFPSTDWLRLLVEHAYKHPTVMVGGYTQNNLSNNPYAIASQLIIDLSYEHYGTSQPLSFFTSNNMLVPTKTIRKLGGFDEAMRCSEDRELCLRWKQAGYSLIYVPEAIMYHAHELTFLGFLRQHYCYGKGAYQFRTRLSCYSSKNTISPNLLFNIWGWLSYPVRHLRGWMALYVTWLFILWQIANLLGFLTMVIQTRLHQHD